jgi:SAM-dependent methyltransferase
VLEIGPGTGQATLPLAQRGWRVTAVELGPQLAEVARAKLDGFPNVTIVTAAFEEWQLPGQPFDLVFAATAFHWIDPAMRITKSAAALRPGGTLATIATHHVRGGSVACFEEVQRCYERWDPATPPGLRLEPADQIPNDSADLEPLFEAPAFTRYEWELTYTTQAYLDLLLTYSGHRALEPRRRTGLLECIGTLIDARYNGTITKRYLSELRTARRAQ